MDFITIFSVRSSTLFTPFNNNFDKNPPQKASPAPVASIGLTFFPSIILFFPLKKYFAPFEPNVSIIIEI